MAGKTKTSTNSTLVTVKEGLDLTKTVGLQPQTTDYNVETYPTVDDVLNKQKTDIEAIQGINEYIHASTFNTGGYTLRIQRDGKFSFDVNWGVASDSVEASALIDRLITFPSLAAVPYFQKFTRAMFNRIEFCLTTATTNQGAFGREIEFKGLLHNDVTVIETIAVEGNKAGQRGFLVLNHSIVGNSYTAGDTDTAKLALLANFEAKLTFDGNTATNVEESDHIVSIKITGQLH